LEQFVFLGRLFLDNARGKSITIILYFRYSSYH